ncbi:MAG: hypothetical protein ABI047_17025 [Jatrophihabitantaceae bacterium]
MVMTAASVLGCDDEPPDEALGDEIAELAPVAVEDETVAGVVAAGDAEEPHPASTATPRAPAAATPIGTRHQVLERAHGLAISGRKSILVTGAPELVAATQRGVSRLPGIR